MLVKVTTAKNVWFFSLLVFNYEFKFLHSICNSCHDLTMLSANLSDIAVITVKGVDYRCIIQDISKSEAIHLLENSVIDCYRHM